MTLDIEGVVDGGVGGENARDGRSVARWPAASHDFAPRAAGAATHEPAADRQGGAKRRLPEWQRHEGQEVLRAVVGKSLIRRRRRFYIAGRR